MHYPSGQMIRPQVQNNQYYMYIQASSMETSHDTAISYVFLSVYIVLHKIQYNVHTFISLLIFFVLNFYRVLRGLNLCLAV